jgi:Family of unknown function (DUF6064)
MISPPFTIEEFLAVFAAYNTAIWPIQIVAYCAGLVVIAALWRKWLAASWIIPVILAFLWACNGIGYHYLYFSTINPLAKGFALLFVLQALLFVLASLSAKKLLFVVERNVRSAAGLCLIAYALLIYPILGIFAGHGLMAGPMFGVAPCPTTIFTIGVLLLTRGRWVPWLSIIPILWSLVGLAAALQLGIPEDLGLPIAGAMLIVYLVLDINNERQGREVASDNHGSSGR